MQRVSLEFWIEFRKGLDQYAYPIWKMIYSSLRLRIKMHLKGYVSWNLGQLWAILSLSDLGTPLKSQLIWTFLWFATRYKFMGSSCDAIRKKCWSYREVFECIDENWFKTKVDQVSVLLKFGNLVSLLLFRIWFVLSLIIWTFSTNYSPQPRCCK